MSAVPAKLGLPTADIWQKGSPIISSKGKDIGRIARQSRCIFKFAAPQDTSLPDGLRAAIEMLQPHRDVLVGLDETGAKIQFFVGLFSDGINARDVLDWKLLSALADLRISLDMDFYGPDQPVVEEDGSGTG